MQQTGTQFTCFTLHWYKSTNTDAARRIRVWTRVRARRPAQVLVYSVYLTGTNVQILTQTGWTRVRVRPSVLTSFVNPRFAHESRFDTERV
jgi:hypothetical protein